MEFDMSKFIAAVQAFVADENGVTAIEYGLIAALIGIVVAGGAKALGLEINTLFGKVETALGGTAG
jgi:pilus assembly protein Flp/PilA